MKCSKAIEIGPLMFDTNHPNLAKTMKSFGIPVHNKKVVSNIVNEILVLDKKNNGIIMTGKFSNCKQATLVEIPQPKNIQCFNWNNNRTHWLTKLLKALLPSKVKKDNN